MRAPTSASLSGDDPEVQSQLSTRELDALFDYTYYTRHVDELCARVGLTAKEPSHATS